MKTKNGIVFADDGDIIAIQYGPTENDVIEATGFDAEIDDQEVEYPVSDELYAWQHHRYARHNHWAAVNEGVEEAFGRGWNGVGTITDPMGSPLDADVETGHYGSGYYGGGHMCEVARAVSNNAEIEYILTEGGGQYFTHAGLFFYRLDDKPTVQLVESMENTLNHYPLLSDDRTSAIEREMARDVFDDLFRGIDHDSINEDDVFSLWLGDSTGCPECGTHNIEEILSSMGHDECAECGDWFDPLHGRTGHEYCTDCNTITRDQVDDVVEDVYGFDPATGEGLIARVGGVDYRFSAGVWSPYTPHVNDHVIGR